MRLAIAASTLLLLTGCGLGHAQLIKPQAPAEAAALCRAIPGPVGNSQDDVVTAYADTIDAYADCAARHKALSDWARAH